jgi:thioesterase domain-containing protein
MPNLDKSKLSEKICNEIPLLKTMQMKITEVTEGHCEVFFPLSPNHNHKGTAFGGSLYTATIAACYALLFSVQQKARLSNRDLVITQGEIQYLKPVQFDFLAIAEVESEALEALLESLNENKSSRISVKSYIRTPNSNLNLCEFKGEFAFIKRKK